MSAMATAQMSVEGEIMAACHFKRKLDAYPESQKKAKMFEDGGEMDLVHTYSPNQQQMYPSTINQMQTSENVELKNQVQTPQVVELSQNGFGRDDSRLICSFSSQKANMLPCLSDYDYWYLDPKYFL